MQENRLTVKGKFPHLTVELDGKQLLAESVSIWLDAENVPRATFTVPLLDEIDIDIPVQVNEETCQS
jgi:hypothetical protein